MDSSAIGIFIHVVGGIGMCVALGIEWVGLWQLRNALQLEQVRTSMSIMKSANKVGFISMVVTLLVGFYMIWIEWGFVGWITVSLVSVFLIIVLNMAVTRPRMMAVGRTLAADKGTLSATFHSLANHPLLWFSIQSRVAIVLGITFLMIAKPDLTISVLTLGIAVALGLASAIPFLRRERVQEGLAR